MNNKIGNNTNGRHYNEAVNGKIGNKSNNYFRGIR